MYLAFPILVWSKQDLKQVEEDCNNKKIIRSSEDKCGTGSDNQLREAFKNVLADFVR